MTRDKNGLMYRILVAACAGALTASCSSEAPAPPPEATAAAKEVLSQLDPDDVARLGQTLQSLATLAAQLESGAQQVSQFQRELNQAEKILGDSNRQAQQMVKGMSQTVSASGGDMSSDEVEQIKREVQALVDELTGQYDDFPVVVPGPALPAPGGPGGPGGPGPGGPGPGGPGPGGPGPGGPGPGGPGPGR